jgi:hypothetical protein
MIQDWIAAFTSDESQTALTTPIIEPAIQDHITTECGFAPGVAMIVVGYLTPCVKTWNDKYHFYWVGPMSRGRVGEHHSVKFEVENKAGWVTQDFGYEWKEEDALRDYKSGQPRLANLKGSLDDLTRCLSGSHRIVSEQTNIAELSPAAALQFILDAYVTACGACLPPRYHPNIPSVDWFSVSGAHGDTELMAIRKAARSDIAAEMLAASRLFETSPVHKCWKDREDQFECMMKQREF